MLSVAPWVVTQEAGGDLLALGPNLVVGRLPKQLFEEPNQEELSALVAQGFVVDDQPSDSSVPAIPATGDRFIVAGELDSLPARALCAELQARDPGHTWACVPSVDMIQRERDAPLAVLLRHHEHRPAADDVRALLERCNVLWLGECHEGTHVGPVFRSVEDAERYDEVTCAWLHVRRLEGLGFRSRWPLPIELHITRHLGLVASAILRASDAATDEAVLVSDGRQVALWSVADKDMGALPELLRRQTWSKGFLRRFRVEPAGSGSIFIGSCSTPSGSVEDLESNSGKGYTRIEAMHRLVGEAVERFAAWRTNDWSLPPAPEGARSYALSAFHPFGPPWDAYRKAGSPPLPTVAARDIVRDEIVSVPECLVSFPYLPRTGVRPSFSDTTGLAAHTTFDAAASHGALEILERHNLYPNFIQQRPGVVIEPQGVVAGWCAGVVDELRAAGTLWLLRYPDELELPIVHAFYQDAQTGYMARGSGNGTSLASAIDDAVVELVQVLEQVRRGPPELHPEGHLDWMDPRVVARVRAYLNAQPVRATAELFPGNVLARLRDFDRPVLVVRVPVGGTSWHVVRVLMPGLTTHQHASESEGGRCLLHPAFPYGIPS
jgi:ribosomal protein S12 methylthiotransferase accessory factor YcaO